jgi:hypothetical protein
LRPDRDAIFQRFASGQLYDLKDRFVDSHAHHPLGAFLMRARIRRMTSPARRPSRTTERLPDLLQIRRLKAQQVQLACALMTAAAIDWVTSWAIEAVRYPIVATRLVCANSICVSQ